MKSKLKIGDIVNLKSGGPDMTISQVLHHDRVWCQWVGDKGNLNEANFHIDTLKKREEEDAHETNE